MINDHGDAGTWLLEERPSTAGLSVLPRSKLLSKPFATSLKCIDSKRIFERSLRRYVTNSFRHAPFTSRSNRCGQGATCGRRVLDGAFSEEDLLEVEEEGVRNWIG